MANFSAAFYSTLIILIIIFIISTILIFRLYWDNKQVLDKNRFLELISLTTQEYIYVYDLKKKKFVYNNRKINAILGYDSQPPNLKLEDFLSDNLHPEDKETLKAVKKNFLKLNDNEVLNFEYRLKHREGHYINILNRIVVFARSSDGEIELVQGSITDITKIKNNEYGLQALLEEAQQMNAELLEQKQELKANLERTLVLNQKLVETEKRFNETEELAKLGSWEIYLPSREIIWSDQAYRNYGLEPGEVAPTMDYFKTLVHPDDIEAVKQREATIGANLESFEFRIILKDGSIRHISSSVESRINEKGEVYKLVGTIQDITERKRAEEHIKELLAKSKRLNDELKRSEESVRKTLSETLQLYEKLAQKEAWLEETQRIAKLGIWEYNTSDNTITATDEVYKLFDLDQNSNIVALLPELINRVYPEDLERLSSAGRLARIKGLPFEMEVRKQSPDGSLTWLYTVVNPIPDASGKVVKLVGITQDINTRKQAEIALAESEHFFKALIQNSSDFVQTIDSNGNIIYQSPTMSRLTGYHPSEREGKSIFELIYPDDREQVIEMRKEVLQNAGSHRTITTRIVHREQRIVWLEATVTNLLDQPGVNALVLNTRDVTGRKEAEERLKRQNEELKKINAELDSFVYRASHDLRAPLSSILGLISISKDEADPGKKAEYLDLMEKSVTKLDLFIRNIIDYSRNSRLQVSMTPINFHELIKSIFEEYKYMEGSEEIEKKIVVNGNTDFYSDPFRLKIIFSNVISNAIRYSNRRVSSFIHIFIHLNKEKAIIEIKDNGRGIPKESIGRIFEMFYRASEYNVGSGLGLYIVKEVVAALEGKISVNSELGTGTSFTFELPNLAAQSQNHTSEIKEEKVYINDEFKK